MRFLATLACVLSVALPAFAMEPAQNPQWIIPPGQEALAESLLAAPPGWTLAGVQLQQDRLVATYRRGTDEQVLVLQQRDQPQNAQARTAQFALTGGLPPELLEALREQIQSREGAWQWKKPAQDQKVAPAVANEADPAAQVARQLEAATAALDGAQPQEAKRLLEAVADLPLKLDPAARTEAELSLAWHWKALQDPRAQALFRRHADAQDRLAFVSAHVGLGEALPQLSATDLAQACTRSAQTAEDLRVGGAMQPALDLLGRVVQADPGCTRAVLEAARLSQRAGQPDKALPLVDAALQKQPGDPELTVLAANLERQQGRLAEALRRVEALDLTKVPPGALVALDLGRVLIDTTAGEQTPGGEAFVQKLRARSDAHPDDAVAGFLMGTILHHRQAWQESNTYLARSAKGFASEPRQYLYAAMNDWHLGKQAEAEALVAQAMQLKRQDPDDWYCRAMILARHQPDVAVADLQRYLDVTQATADNNPMKHDKVVRYMADLRACRDAGNIGRCLDLRAARHDVEKHWPAYGGALLGLLAAIGAIVLWRRKAAAVLLFALAGSLAHHDAQAQPRSQLQVQASTVRPSRQEVAPQTLEAQLSWQSDLELTQVALDAALLLASGVFFSP